MWLDRKIDIALQVYYSEFLNFRVHVYASHHNIIRIHGIWCKKQQNFHFQRFVVIISRPI